jgi:hypothetical protein
MVEVIALLYRTLRRVRDVNAAHSAGNVPCMLLYPTSSSFREVSADHEPGSGPVNLLPATTNDTRLVMICSSETKLPSNPSPPRSRRVMLPPPSHVIPSQGREQGAERPSHPCSPAAAHELVLMAAC